MACLSQAFWLKKIFLKFANLIKSTNGKIIMHSNLMLFFLNGTYSYQKECYQQSIKISVDLAMIPKSVR